MFNRLFFPSVFTEREEGPQNRVVENRRNWLMTIEIRRQRL